MEKKQDLRTQRTQQHLRRALCELLQQKPVNKISIRELTERAEVSRCTFYLYYDSIFSMITALEEDMLSDYRSGLEKILSEKIASRQLFKEIIAFAFEHKKTNLPYSKLLYSTQGNPEFLRRYILVTIEELDSAFPGKINDHVKTALNFYFSGVLSFIQNWILQDGSGEPEALAAQVVEIIQNGGSYLDMLGSR